MTIWEHYNNYLSNPQDCESWVEYYNVVVTKKWIRQSKQRNYKRNKDIVYQDSKIKYNGLLLKYNIRFADYDYFYIDNQFLKLEYSSQVKDESHKTRNIYPFRYMTAFVDDEMNLVADIPNMIIDAEFKIENNGNLILKYG